MPIWVWEMLGIVLTAVNMYVFAILTSNIMESKGYKGGFIIGFFFTVIGLFYAHALADKRTRLEIKISDTQKQIVYLDGDQSVLGDETHKEFEIKTAEE